MKGNLYRKILLCVLIYFVCFNTGFGQDKISGRPKIGLTLSGGGAKGLAHIGILQAIDSAGLKVDFITGTSMGSIMGAMYAAGYSGDSIEKIARTLDWNLLFSTSPQLRAITIEEKKEYDKYAVEIPFVDGKFKIGKGIIEGQELWLKMSEVFQPVYDITDFSKLSIPFNCIGTDLETGNAVVMDHGNIVTAIRASMAIPSVFTPVKYDNHLLVDGGVVNNFPVLDVKEMGARVDQGEERVANAQQEVDAWWGGLSTIEQNNPVNKAKYENANRALSTAGNFLSSADAAVNNIANSTVQYSLEKRPVQKWNFTVGSQFQLNMHWMLRAEYGFLGTRQQYFVGLQYRFGL